MAQPFYLVDAFAETPFTGNPAVVVPLAEPRDEAWYQRLAAEMNQSETAYLLPKGPSRYNLRWFTPQAEVDLCGHATLASAFALWETRRADPDTPIVFETRSGELTCELSDDWVEMDFPVIPLEAIPAAGSGYEALGPVQEPRLVARAGVNLLVHLQHQEEVLHLAPDFSALAALPYQGVIVTAKALNSEHEIVSRYFAPKLRIHEDPVTGSAHCALGPYWANELGKRDILAYQASARGGVLRLIHRGERITLCGHALLVGQGELLI